MGQRFRISTIMIQIAAALVVAACTGAQPNKDSVNSLRTLAKSEELPENAPASKIAIAAASTDVRLSQAIANDPELLTQLQKVEEIAASIPQPMATSLIELWLQTDSLNANNAANYLEVLVEILAAIKSQPGTLALESHLDSDVDCKAKLEDELKNYRSKRTSDIIGRLIQQLTACVESAPVQLRHDASVISGMLRTASLNMHPSAVDFSDAKATLLANLQAWDDSLLSDVSFVSHTTLAIELFSVLLNPDSVQLKGSNGAKGNSVVVAMGDVLASGEEKVLAAALVGFAQVAASYQSSGNEAGIATLPSFITIWFAPAKPSDKSSTVDDASESTSDETNSSPEESDSGSTVDQPAPSALAPVLANVSADTSDTTPTWSWTSGGQGNGTFRYKLDSSDLSSGATETTSTSFTPSSAISEGSHTLYVQERNVVGVWSSSGSYAVTIDTTTPQAPTISEASKTFNTSFSTSLAQGSPSDANFLAFRYTLTGVDPTCSTGTQSSAQPTSVTIPAATTTIKVITCDRAGNASSVASAVYTYDNSTPGTPSVTSTAADTSDTTPTWSWTSGGQGNGTFRYKLDSSDLSSGATETTSTSFTPSSAISEGSHTLYVQERNVVGVWSSSGSYAVTIDTTTPQAPTISEASKTFNTSFSTSLAQGSPSDANFLAFRYTLTGVDPTCSTGTQSSAQPTSVTIPAATTTIKVITCDRAGNASSVASATYTYDGTPPDAPSNFRVMRGYNRAYLEWTSGGGDTAGFTVPKKQSTALTWSPDTGATYVTGDNIGSGVSIGYNGTATSFQDSSLSSTPYYYRLYSYDSLKNYTTTTVSGAVDPSSNLVVGGGLGAVRNMVKSGSYIYAITGRDTASAQTSLGTGLLVIDATTKRIVGTRALHGGNLLYLAAQGNYVYVTSETLGIVVFDVSTPSKPMVVNTIAGTTFTRLALSADGATLFAQNAATTLIAYDVSTPTSPVSRGTYTRTKSGNIVGMALSGSYIFLTLVTTDLEVVDVSSLNSLTYAGFEDSDATARTRSCSYVCNMITISGNYAYVIAYNTSRGIQVFNISTPTSPTLAGSKNSSHASADGKQSVLVGSTLYVAASSNGNANALESYDVTDPANIPNSTLLTLPAQTGGAFVSSVVAHNSTLFISDSEGTNVKGATGIIVVESGAVQDGVPNTPNANRIAVSGNYTYVADSSSGLVVFDTTDPSRPIPIGMNGTTQTVSSVATYNGAYSVAASGNYAFATPMNYRELGAFDVSTKSSPTYSSYRNYSVTYFLDYATINGNYAYTLYASGGGSTTYIFNITNPLSIPAATTATLLATTKFATASANYLYAAAGANRVGIYDVSGANATAPSLSAQTSSSETPNAVHLAISGNMLYVADATNGLVIYDVTSKSSPVYKGTLAITGLSKVAVNGNYVAAGTTSGALYLVNVSDPTNPSLSGTSVTLYYSALNFEFRDIQPNGKYFYIAYGKGGFLVIDALP